MKDLRQCEHYVICGLLILLIILVGWLISSQPRSCSSRYQVHYEDGPLVFVFEPATGHLWLRFVHSGKGYVSDWGTMEKPSRGAVEVLDDLDFQPNETDFGFVPDEEK
jgi:hypothetical protein